jgi:hypothetical protein
MCRAMSNVVSGYRVGGTMAAGDLLCDHVDQKVACCSNHVEVTNMVGGINGWIPPPH